MISPDFWTDPSQVGNPVPLTETRLNSYVREITGREDEFRFAFELLSKEGVWEKIQASLYAPFENKRMRLGNRLGMGGYYAPFITPNIGNTTTFLGVNEEATYQILPFIWLHDMGSQRTMDLARLDLNYGRGRKHQPIKVHVGHDRFFKNEDGIYWEYGITYLQTEQSSPSIPIYDGVNFSNAQIMELIGEGPIVKFHHQASELLTSFGLPNLVSY